MGGWVSEGATIFKIVWKAFFYNSTACLGIAISGKQTGGYMPSVCILEMFIVGFLVDFYKKQQVYKSSIQVLILYLRELLIKKYMELC